MMTDIPTSIANELGVETSQVVATIKLLNEGATVPFIARYRKEVTGGLDDTQLRTLEERLHYLTELDERRTTILNSIREQEKLTPELEQAILAADNKTRLEDLYLPYKPKRRTRGQMAREAGLQPLADSLFENPDQDPETLAAGYVNSELGIEDSAAALDGAKYILMEQFSEDADLLASIRNYMLDNGILAAKVVAEKEKDGAKYRDYFDHKEALKKTPSHRALAIFRGRKEGILQVNISVVQDNQDSGAERHPCEVMIANHFAISNQGRPADPWLQQVVGWCWRIKLLPQVETELLSDLRDQAEQEAIKVFSTNLKDLLMAAPAGPRVTMGLDPGLRTGVKVAIVDATGLLLEHGTIFPHAPRKQWDESIATLAELIKKHNVELISIGNGTASRETDKLVADLLKQHAELKATKIMVSEAGASVYSASEFAAKEFPKLDVSFRGAVSIARRLQDPLAELVKIDPKAIGVGQYQHDVGQSKMARSLNAVVEDCVNAVGVDVNTASEPLLARIAGLNKTIAGNIVAFRHERGAFNNRDELKQVPRLGDRTFEQAAGFLRIMAGDNPLDRSAVHPEAYPVVTKIAQLQERPVAEVIGDSQFLQSLNAEQFIDEHFGLPTVTDIIKELEKPGRDPRPEFKTAAFKDGVDSINDLKPDMILEGVVTNVTNFGAFVDIGVHQDGLVHISVLSNNFVKDPRDVVKAGDIVKVKVTEIDQARKRIGLSMRLDATATPEKRPADSKKPQRRGKDGKQANQKPGAKQGNRNGSKPSKKGNEPDGKTGTFADLFANAKKLRK